MLGLRLKDLVFIGVSGLYIRTVSLPENIKMKISENRVKIEYGDETLEIILIDNVHDVILVKLTTPPWTKMKLLTRDSPEMKLPILDGDRFNEKIVEGGLKLEG